jgi:capsular exopolysaccharide synthesis family protein
MSSSAMPEEFYITILESRDYFTAVFKRIHEIMPYLDTDSLIAAGGIGYKTKENTTQFLYIIGASQNPEFATILTEQAMIAFQEKNVEIRRSDAQNVLDFIEVQLDELSAKLIANEAHMRDFLAERGLTYSDVSKGLDNELTALQRSLSEAEGKRDMAKLQIDTYTRQIDERLNTFLGSKQTDETLNNNRTRLKMINAELSDSVSGGIDTIKFRQLNQERKKILSELITAGSSNGNDNNLTLSLNSYESRLEGVMVEYETALVQIAFFENAVQRFKREHPNLSQDILDYFTISRSKQVLQATIDLLVSQRETTRIKVASESGGVKIIDHAGRATLISQQRSRKILTFFLIALAIGIALAYAVDLIDNTIQSENDIINKFSLPVFGSVPVLDSRRFLLEAEKRAREGGVSVSSEPIDITLLSNHPESSPIAEAYRSIRTALQFAAKERDQKVFVISSSVAAEGKSITTFNIGVSFAQSGMRVLLVDADLRRPTQHKKARIRRSPGLSDHLLEQATFDESVVRNVIPNLDIMPAGQRIKNPADLLQSKRMALLMEQFAEMYDLVLFDTPPITPCMDSRHLASMTKGIILVARAEVTKKNLFAHAIDLCNRVNIDVEGVVVNHVQFRYGYGYYYVYQRYNPNSYGYYYSGYQYYYSQDNETGERIKKKRRTKTPRSGSGQSTTPPEESV